MSHAVYQTPAIILSAKNMRESNKLMVLYTEKFGLIYISIQSARELKSKMRFHLNIFSLVDVDLIQGRDIWKLTGIHEYYSSLSFIDTSWYVLVNKVSDFLLRLCKGEEVNNDIWTDFKMLYCMIQNIKDISKEDENRFEIILISRILYYLGYWKGEEYYIFAHNPFQKEYYNFIDENRTKLIILINQGIKDSQL